MFCYGVKRYHYRKLIGIRELLELLDLDLFNNTSSTDTGTQANNIHPLDAVDEGKTVSTYHAIHFSSSISPSVAARTISDITLNSDSLISYTLVTSNIG